MKKKKREKKRVELFFLLRTTFSWCWISWSKKESEEQKRKRIRDHFQKYMYGTHMIELAGCCCCCYLIIIYTTLTTTWYSLFSSPNFEDKQHSIIWRKEVHSSRGERTNCVWCRYEIDRQIDDRRWSVQNRYRFFKISKISKNFRKRERWRH